MLVDFPERIETERLHLRSIGPGDGGWYFQAGQRNREHLQEYEAGNAMLEPGNEQEAEILVRELAAEWTARRCFFIGAFKKDTQNFVAQVYIGPVNWDLPEFEIGYIADVDQEGQGYVTEAVRAVLAALFDKAGAHRVRLMTDETNLRSHKVAERCGFRLEGTLRESRRRRDGSFGNDLLYGLLRREFSAYNPAESPAN
jgi:RimJ/RimL family protein N-acetyltransferase